MSHGTLLLSNIVTTMKRFCNFDIETRGKYFLAKFNFKTTSNTCFRINYVSCKHGTEEKAEGVPIPWSAAIPCVPAPGGGVPGACMPW
jgi:hypothetical protein